MKKINALFIALLITAGAFAQTKWNIDKAHSKIGFTVPHYAISEVEGNFKDFDATVTSTADDFNGADVTFTAKVTSIDTDNERRDGHLKSAEIFDAEKFPDVSFKGKLVKEGAGYKLKGDFTMKGVTKPVTFDVTYGGKVDTGRGTKAGFKLNGQVNRQEYNVTYGGKAPGGEVVIGDTVTINCKIELDKQA
jgi:polyisoprenoid-binding protein YceI